jgi:hypothetical protein
MIRDPMLLVNVQLAIMGIVLVAGLFYLWRMICRVEKRVDDFIQTSKCECPVVKMQGTQEEHPEISDEEAEAFMKEVFGTANPLFINTQPSVQITEEPQVAEEIDTQSVATTSGTLSKSKLKRMSLDNLKDICKEKGLSTDGSKTALVDRILATLDEVDE